MLSNFCHSIAVPFDLSLDLLVGNFQFVGHRHNSLFQIHHTGNTGDIVDGPSYTIAALLTVHTVNLEGLGGYHNNVSNDTITSCYSVP